MSPLPTTRTIHKKWSRHHYVTVDGTFNAECQVLRRAEGESIFDPETGNTIPPAAIVIYSGGCRVQSVMIPRAEEVVAADQVVAVRGYLVVIGAAVGLIKPGLNEDWIEFTSSPNDPSLTTRRFSIQSVTFGSEKWETDLVCLDDFARNMPA